MKVLHILPFKSLGALYEVSLINAEVKFTLKVTFVLGRQTDKPTIPQSLLNLGPCTTHTLFKNQT